MGKILMTPLFWGVFFSGGTIFVVIALVAGSVLFIRALAEQKEATGEETAEPEFPETMEKVTVVGQSCGVKTVGLHTPKTVREFSVAFQRENGSVLTLNIPEEMYGGFEKGQVGMLRIVDGELYSFELEKAE